MKRALLVVALAAASASSFAGSLSRTNVGGFEVRNSGNTWWIGNAAPRPGDVWGWTTDPSATVPVSPNFGLHQDANGPFARANGKIPVPGSNGRNLPVVVNARIPKAGAIKAIAKIGANLLPYGGLALSVLSLMGDMGIEYDDGQPVSVTPPSGGFCLSDSGVTNACNGVNGSTIQGTPQAVCDQNLAWHQAAYPQYSWSMEYRGPTGGYTYGYCERRTNSYSGFGWGDLWIASPPAPPGAEPTHTPVTEAEIEAKLNERFWDDKATKALEESIRLGQEVPHDDPTVEGPAQLEGPQQNSTKQNPDGSTTQQTVQNTYHNTYEGSKITITNTSTVTTTTTHPDGTTETTTESSTSEAPEQDRQEDYSFTDPNMPPVPDLYEQKFPDGLAGVWNTRKAELMASPVGSLITSLMPNIGTGGSCPSWPLPLDVGWQNFGEVDMAPPCIVWDFGKIIIIISALLLARRLIFGG